jgi:cytidine deaminase
MDKEPLPFDKLSQEEQRLIDSAFDAAKNSYSPYSNFAVGAAVLTADGHIYGGCNIENAAWTPSICSERVALSKAVSEGHRHFKALAIICLKQPGGWSCGVCRQFISEFGLDIDILTVVDSNKSVFKKSLRELLPDAFGPSSL